MIRVVIIETDALMRAALRSVPAKLTMAFVAARPQRFSAQLSDVFGNLDTLVHVFRQIGHDDRVHKLESLREAAVAAGPGTRS